jgi:hypothetical protein
VRRDFGELHDGGDIHARPQRDADANQYAGGNGYANAYQYGDEYGDACPRHSDANADGDADEYRRAADQYPYEHEHPIRERPANRQRDARITGRESL